MPQGRVSANSKRSSSFSAFLSSCLPDVVAGCKRIVEDTLALMFSALFSPFSQHDVTANIIPWLAGLLPLISDSFTCSTQLLQCANYKQGAQAVASMWTIFSWFSRVLFTEHIKNRDVSHRREINVRRGENALERSFKPRIKHDKLSTTK